MEIAVEEELISGTELGRVKAVDKDLGENADIDYALIGGNEFKIFEVIIH